MKNQKGFIQIPLLIAIIAGVLVISGVGYVGVKQYRNYQVEKEKIAQESQQQKDSEVENLRKEVEELKKLQTKMEQVKPPSVSETKKIFSTAQIVALNKNFIVSILCQNGSDYVLGSGIVIGRKKGNLIVLTNYHVTKYAQIPSGSNPHPPCIIQSTQNSETYSAQPIYYPSVASQNIMDTIDFSFIEIGDPLPLETLDITTGKLSPAVPTTKLLSMSIFPKICNQDSLKAGEEIVIIGYPTIGGNSIFPGVPDLKSIATEGIVSNDVYKNDNFFVSSAKIEQGNSGGGAFLKSTNCLAGMPTFVNVGEIESLGRLMNLPKLQRDYLSKIF